MRRALARLTGRLSAGARQATLYAAAIASTKALALLMAPVFTHYLSPEDYGRLDILQSLADLLSILIGFGLADTLFRFAGGARTDCERDRVIGEILGFALFTTAACVLVLQLAAPFIHEILPGAHTLLDVRLILFSLSLSALILAPMAALRQSGRAGLYAGATIGRAIVQAALVALFLSWGLGVTGALTAGLIAGSSLCVLVFALQARRTPVRAPSALSRRLVVYALPLISVGLAGFLIRGAEKFFLADAVGPSALAEYALATKIALAGLIFVQPFEMWYFARRFVMLNEPDGVVRCARAAGVGAAVAFAAAGAAALGGGAFILLFTPESYHGAVIFLPLLTMAAAVHSTTGFFNLGLYAGESTLRLLLLESAVAACALGIYAFAIGRFGLLGAATGVLAVTIIRLAAVFCAAQATRPLPYDMRAVLLRTAPACAGSVASFLMLRISGPALAGLAPAFAGACLTVAAATAANPAALDRARAMGARLRSIFGVRRIAVGASPPR